MVDEVWRRLLASDEAQKLVERIAEAPELRAAISAQSMGLIEDVGHTIGKATRRLDAGVERIARKVFFRVPSARSRASRAGAVTRAARLRPRRADRQPRLLRPGRARGADRLGDLRQRQRRLRAGRWPSGSVAWAALGALYLVAFWSLAGQTPGMRFFDIRLGPEGTRLSLAAAR